MKPHNTMECGRFLLDYPMGESGPLLKDEIWTRNIYHFDSSRKGLVIDIGANIGAFSILASQHANKVIAYEPEKTNFKYLKRNIEKNNIENVEIHKLGAGKKGNARIIPMYSGSYVGELGKEPVRLIGLNDMGFEQCDFLKVDCEGSEFNLIKYASPETLKKIKFIAMEVHFDLVPKKKHDELLNKLRKYFEIIQEGQMLYGQSKYF